MCVLIFSYIFFSTRSNKLFDNCFCEYVMTLFHLCNIKAIFIGEFFINSIFLGVELFFSSLEKFLRAKKFQTFKQKKEIFDIHGEFFFASFAVENLKLFFFYFEANFFI